MLTELNELAKHYEYLIKVVGAFLPFLIAIFMVYIAYQQWQTNERKRRQDLFDRRWDLYKRIRNKFNELMLLHFKKNEAREKYYIEGILKGESLDSEELKEVFENLKRSSIFNEFQEEVYFLFGEEVNIRLRELQNKKHISYEPKLDANKQLISRVFDIYFKDVFSKYLCIEPTKQIKYRGNNAD